MNIAIFETTHFECAYPMIRIMDTPENKLTIFVNQEIHSHLELLFANDMNRYKWVIKPASTSNRVFIREVYRHCKKNKIERLFLNTVTAHFILYAWAALLLPSTKFIVTLHDVNSFLRSSFTSNIRRTIRHMGKRILGRTCYAYNTISETVRDHMIASMHVRKKIFCIPGGIFEEERYVEIKYEPGTAIRIVVPGTIDGRRRNYSQVLALLDLAEKTSLPIEITVAGGSYGSYGRQMIKQFQAYSQTQSNLIFYNQPELDQISFDKTLNASHFIWNPSVIKTVIEDGIEETYGLTKASGNIFDAITHARPMLVPTALKLPSQFVNAVFCYDSIEQIVDYLGKIIRNPEIYHSLAKKAFINSSEYTVDKIRPRTKDT